MEKLDWRDYGARPDDDAFDCSEAINKSFTDAIAYGMESFGPAGTYRIEQSLHWNHPVPRISGMGAKTVIAPHNNNYSALTIGTGEIDPDEPIIGPAGWVRDLWINGSVTTPSPPGTTAGFELNCTKFVEVRNVWVSWAPIGFKLINNNYGSSFYNCRTLFNECRIGLFLEGAVVAPPPAPSTEGAGNDISFYNCWFHGGDTAVWLEGNQGLYHFFGGQLAGGGGGTPSDDRGACITSGKSLSTGLPMGSCGVSLHGVTCERASDGWTFRHFGQGSDPTGLSLYCTMCSFFAGTNAIGILKLTGGYNDRITFDQCSVAPEPWSNSVPIVIAGAGSASRPYYAERGTRGKAQFAGVLLDFNDRPMLVESHIPHSYAQGANLYQQNALTLFFTDEGEILVSTDYGEPESFDKKVSIVDLP